MTDDPTAARTRAAAPAEDRAPYEREGRGGASARRTAGGSEAPTQAIPAVAGAARPAAGAGSARVAGGERTAGRTGERGGPARVPRPGAQDAGTATATAAARPASRRRARLALSRIDPWSVFVLSLLASLCLGVVLLVALAVLYSLLKSLGVLDSINTFAQDLQIIKDGQQVISLSRVLTVGAVLAAVDVVLLTVLATLGAFLYNLCAVLTGGVEVVLGERD